MSIESFPTKPTIEILQGAYVEAQRMEDLAWKHVSDEMLAESPLQIGDKFATNESSVATGYKGTSMFRQKEEKVLQVTNMHVRFHNSTWQIRASAYPIKKDGTVAVKGEFQIWDVEGAVKHGQIKILTDDAN